MKGNLVSKFIKPLKLMNVILFLSVPQYPKPSYRKRPTPHKSSIDHISYSLWGNRVEILVIIRRGDCQTYSLINPIPPEVFQTQWPTIGMGNIF